MSIKVLLLIIILLYGVVPGSQKVACLLFPIINAQQLSKFLHHSNVIINSRTAPTVPSGMNGTFLSWCLVVQLSCYL